MVCNKMHRQGQLGHFAHELIPVRGSLQYIQIPTKKFKNSNTQPRSAIPPKSTMLSADAPLSKHASNSLPRVPKLHHPTRVWSR